MKAGSLQRMTTPLLVESPERRHPQEKCASKCIRGFLSLCLHLFFNTTNLILHVWLSSDNNSDFRLPIADLLESGGKSLRRNKSKDKDLRAEYKSAIGN
jgi:hypothetical protein